MGQFQEIHETFIFSNAKKPHGGRILLSHCQGVLKEQLIKFRARKKKTSFHFHLGNTLQICLSKPMLKNRFQVIDCSFLADFVGLTNVLTTVRNCLANDPTAIMLTDLKTGIILNLLSLNMSTRCWAVPSLCFRRFMA